MAINRISIVSGETQSPNEFIAMGGSNASISSVKKHTGNYSILFNNQFSSRTIAMGLPLINVLRSNYFLNHSSGTAGEFAILYLVHASGQTNYEIDIRWDLATNSINMKIDSALVSSISAIVAGLADTNVWLPIGLYVESGSEGKVVLYINGLEVLRYDGEIKENFDYITACGTWPTGLIPAGWAGTVYLDDWYTEELTDSDIEELSPPSPGWMTSVVLNRVSVQWTPVGAANNNEAVDDPGPHDGDTTYVYTRETGETDLYSLSDVTLPTNYVIDAVVPYAIARKTDAGLNAQLKFVAFDGLSTAESGIVLLPVSYRPVYGRMKYRPNGSEYTQSSFNAMGFGFESEGNFE